MTLSVLVQAGHEGGLRNLTNTTTTPSAGTANSALGYNERDWTPIVADATATWLVNHGITVFREDGVLDSNPSLSGFQSYTVDYAVFIHFDGNNDTGVTAASVGYSLDNRGGTNDAHFATTWKDYYVQQGWNFGFHSDNFTDNLSGYYGYSYATGTRGELVLELGTMTNNTAATWLHDHLTQIGQWIGEAIYIDSFGSLPGGTDDYLANTNTTGVVTAGGGQVLGNIETAADRDWFRVQVTQGSTYTINLVNGSVPQVAPFLADPEVYLYNSSGQFVDSNDDFGGLNSQLTFTATYTGNYFIGAGEHGDNATGTYRVSVSAGSTPVTFGVSSQTGAEGSTLTFRINIQNPNYAVTPDYLIYYNTTNSTATAGTDYNGITNQVALHFTASSQQFFDVAIQTLTDSNPNEGSEAFNFNIYDFQHVLLKTAQGTINDVALPNQAPDAKNDQFTAQQSQTISGSVLVNNGFGADSDPENDPLSVDFLNNALTTAGGHVTLNANGSFQYTAPASGSSDSFNYTLRDDHGHSDVATVNITLNAQPNQAPDARNDQFAAQQSQTISGSVLVNNGFGADSDPENDPLSVDFLNNALTTAGGHVTLNANGSFQYTAPASGSSDSFNYTLRDDHGHSDVATVNISLVAPQAGSVSINDVSITEGDSGTKIENFTVTRSGGSAAFDVNFTTADGTATVADHDYIATAGTLHFGAGVNTQTIPVTIDGDTRLENSETFLVNLSGATNGAIIGDGSALGTIANDEGTRSPHEFNGDGKNDFLWRNDNGSVATWDMNDRSLSGAVIGTASNDWHIADTGDFNGDGRSDLLWRNDSGAVATWNMNDRSSAGALIGNASNDWHIAGTGDFNGDHKSDILWRNDNGSVATWDMNDRSANGAVIGNASNDWHIAGTGDFNGDGKTDILWRNDSGAVATWDMNDRSVNGAVIANVSNDWHIEGTGDFNGDGKTDILWRNDSGAVATWDMNDRSSNGAVIATVTNDWHIAETGDFNGDHKADILWRNDNGAVATWDMDDRSYSGAVIATTPNDWHIV